MYIVSYQIIAKSCQYICQDSKIYFLALQRREYRRSDISKQSVAGRLLIAIGRRGRIGNKDPQTTHQANTRANTFKIIAQMEIYLFTLCLHISSDLRMLTSFYKCVDNTFVIVGSHHRLEVLTTTTTCATLGRYCT